MIKGFAKGILAGGLAMMLMLPQTGHAGPSKKDKLIHRAKNENPTAAYKWLEILLEASGRDVDRNKARPTILSRTMAIVLTSMYDAWSAYDPKAVGTRLGDKLRRPASEHNLKNKETAIAYAAYRALLFVYAEDEKWIKETMKKAGYDPENNTQDITTPEGVGNVAAAALIEYRKNDGANQLGNEVGGNGKPYSDYTYYKSKNTPTNIVDPLTWMPITFSDGKGGKVAPNFLTAHFYRVKPFALERADQFRPGEPPQWGSKQLDKEIDEFMKANANLTLEQKAIVEFMRDGPRSTGQSGHWLQFAQDVSRRDQNNLDEDIKLFFSVGNIVFDAFIACWETKRFYDTSRPYWWARITKKGQVVKGWAGPGKGVKEIKGEEWIPYSPDIFITPPFPGYVSGHATASAAAATILELFTGSNKFKAIAIKQVGDLTEAEFSTAQMQAVDGKPAMNVPESKEVILDLPTFWATAEMAAESRMLGGYHIRTDNEEGLKLGKKVAKFSWPIYQSYFNGTHKTDLK